jgi:hypothetical protein
MSGVQTPKFNLIGGLAMIVAGVVICIIGLVSK